MSGADMSGGGSVEYEHGPWAFFDDPSKGVLAVGVIVLSKVLYGITVLADEDGHDGLLADRTECRTEIYEARESRLFHVQSHSEVAMNVAAFPPNLESDDTLLSCAWLFKPQKLGRLKPLSSHTAPSSTCDEEMFYAVGWRDLGISPLNGVWSSSLLYRVSFAAAERETSDIYTKLGIIVTLEVRQSMRCHSPFFASLDDVRERLSRPKDGLQKMFVDHLNRNIEVFRIIATNLFVVQRCLACACPPFLRRHNGYCQVFSPSGVFVVTSAASSRRASHAQGCLLETKPVEHIQICGCWGDFLRMIGQPNGVSPTYYTIFLSLPFVSLLVEKSHQRRVSFLQHQGPPGFKPTSHSKAAMNSTPFLARLGRYGPGPRKKHGWLDSAAFNQDDYDGRTSFLPVFTAASRGWGNISARVSYLYTLSVIVTLWRSHFKPVLLKNFVHRSEESSHGRSAQPSVLVRGLSWADAYPDGLFYRRCAQSGMRVLAPRQRAVSRWKEQTFVQSLVIRDKDGVIPQFSYGGLVNSYVKVHTIGFSHHKLCAAVYVSTTQKFDLILMLVEVRK
ncbi:hypothetical protein EV421DRAFT_2019384 [Armillaria borealis]|uniref:Uncharacterized protein n=1 Tax=Armillaria borealis TaxID=47425 RepID=A0AA39JGW6_9AGAR|nr:hypothetical protein EV421DRAFT_2019384 [Armillaria borealis]